MNEQYSGNVDKEMYQFSLFCFFILSKCSLNLVLSKSPHLLKVEMAMRKIVLKVVNFNEAFPIGSKGCFCIMSRTNCRSHSGKILTVGGLELKTPFSNLTIYGCCPTGTFPIGCKTADNIDLSPAIVLYCKPA